MKISEITARGFRFSVIRDDKEVGRAHLYIMTNDLHNEPFGFIEDVWVDQNYRGQKIGSELIKKVIAQANTEGCYKLIATSRHSRTKVHALYEKLCFDNHGIEFRMNLL